MHELPFVLIHPRPVRHVGILVVVVPLTHPQEVTGEEQLGAVLQTGDFHRPEVVVTRPAASVDAMAVADVLIDAVLFDHFPHVLEDLVCACNRRADPGLEPVAEGIQVRI